jgi:hypothetical protein
MGHKTLNMTLEYARILDRTVEQAFNEAVERMQTGPLSWVPNFFAPEDYTLFAEGDAINWIRLPHGYCRRHHKLTAKVTSSVFSVIASVPYRVIFHGYKKCATGFSNSA